jgi:hypothetical protein
MGGDERTNEWVDETVLSIITVFLPSALSLSLDSYFYLAFLSIPLPSLLPSFKVCKGGGPVTTKRNVVVLLLLYLCSTSPRSLSPFSFVCLSAHSGLYYYNICFHDRKGGEDRTGTPAGVGIVDAPLSNGYIDALLPAPPSVFLDSAPLSSVRFNY